MVTEELLRRLRSQDMSAYNYIYEKYGWELHNYLREKYPDKDTAAVVFRKAINDFCADLSAADSLDVMEIALYMYADRVTQQMGREPLRKEAQLDLPEFPIPEKVPESTVSAMPEPAAPAVQGWDDWSDLDPEPAKAEPKRRSAAATVGKILLILVLTLIVVGAVWVALGFVIKLELIPGFRPDLGYSWFNRSIAPWLFEALGITLVF